MTDRERLLEILNKPIFPHEMVDPLEAVADYLLDNGLLHIGHLLTFCSSAITPSWRLQCGQYGIFHQPKLLPSFHFFCL